MHKKFSAVFFLFLFTRTIQANEFKAMIGLNSSKYLFTAALSSLNSQQKTGVTLGLGWAFDLDRKIKLEVNALYSKGGAKASMAYPPDQSLSGYYRNTSMALPIFLKYQFYLNL